MTTAARSAPAQRAAPSAKPRTARAALPAPARSPAAAGALRAAGRAALGSGAPLEPGLRTQFESRFGADFGDVRVHLDAQATSWASLLGARAFARGDDIVFGAGHFAPWTAEGRGLVAHELAHVVQQRRGGAEPAPGVSAAHEQAAQRAAQAFSQAGGPVAVEGATGTGVACDEERREPGDDFYVNAFHGNRAWYWGSFGKPIPGWPVDPKLQELWNALPVSRQKGQEVPGADPRAIAKSPPLREFVDTVREFQHARMPAVDRSIEGTVDPRTADLLRAREAERKSAAMAKVPKTVAARPALSGTGFAAGASLSGHVSAGTTLADRALGVLSDPGGAARSYAKEAIESFSTDKLKALLLDSVIRAFHLPPTGTRIAMKVAEGMADQLVQELVREGKGRKLLDHLSDFSLSDSGELLKGYYVGLAEGVVSPLTDLFGILTLGEQLKKGGEDMLASAFNNRNRIGAEWKALVESVDEVTLKLAAFWEGVKAHPADAVLALLNAPDALTELAESKAYELGKAGGSAVVAGLEEPWQPPKEEGPAPDPLGMPAAYVEHMAKKAENYVLSSPWAKIGSKFGYAIGFVAIQAILIAFTSGVGNAIEEVGVAMGKVAGALGKVAKGAGMVAARVAEFVAMVGKGIAAVEEVIALLIGKALKPLEKLLEPLLEPMGRMFEKLRAFLRKLFGVAEKEGVALVDAAAGKGANALGDEASKVAPKPLPPPGEPKPVPKAKAPATNAAADEALVEPKPKAQPKAKAKAATTDADVEPKAKPKARTKAAKPDATTEPKAKPTAKSKAAKPDATAEPKAKPKAKSKAAKPDATVEPKAKPQAKPKAKTKASPKPKAPARTKSVPEFAGPAHRRPGPNSIDLDTAGTGGIKKISFLDDPEGRFAVKIKGELQEGLYRGKGPAPKGKVKAPNYNRSDKLLSNREVGLDSNWENAHLWGPGFGDEAMAGMMKAPKSVNQWYQNEGIEGWARDLRKAAGPGAKIEVEATAVAWKPSELAWKPKAQADFLKRVEYRVNLTTGAGEKASVHVTIDVLPPPKGGVAEFKIDPIGAANPADLLNIVAGKAK